MSHHQILWRRVDVVGLDACRLQRLAAAAGWQLSGSAIYHEDGVLAQVHYDVRHDQNWRTQSCRVTGWANGDPIDLSIVRDVNLGWMVNEQKVEGLDDALDVDLGFTPATNTTAIRRLGLSEGEKAQAKAAWLNTDTWSLQPLLQSYERLGEDRFQYVSLASGFSAELVVNAAGLVTDYPGIWVQDA